MVNYFVYILECNDGTLYTGIATDVRKRLRKHNGELVGGAKYTASRRPVRLLAQSIPLKNRSQALKLEYAVKKQRADKKIEFLLS
ncbi:MAG: GIY-YIG nuclease family protein [Lentisphaeraceae bacterium]|nr:GIY-YIG nuclease family protein [Lentisphaeraceae bacterium]